MKNIFRRARPWRRERAEAWFFRNALARANYADYERGVKRDWSVPRLAI